MEKIHVHVSDDSDRCSRIFGEDVVDCFLDIFQEFRLTRMWSSVDADESVDRIGFLLVIMDLDNGRC